MSFAAHALLEHNRAVSAWLDGATDDDLDELRPSHLGEPRSAGDVIAVLVDEQVHHGAEIALLRDLYVHRFGAPATS